jgi:serine/threonine protein kinase
LFLKINQEMMSLYCAQISLALAHLHAHLVIYRDLKSENILLDRFGHVKLIDFGLAKKVSSYDLSTVESSKATFCGTPEYLSPEMIIHRKKVNTLYFLWFKTFLILLIVTNRWITEN